MTSKRESEVVSKPIIWQLEFQRKWILDGILHLIFLRKFAQRIVDITNTIEAYSNLQSSSKFGPVQYASLLSHHF